MTKQTTDGLRGPSSFCIPRTALEALLECSASAYEICAYLVLACFTDKTGRFSTASISAVNRYTGANKLKGGPIDRAIEALKDMRVEQKVRVKDPDTGRCVIEAVDLGPILYDRAAWQAETGEELPDGPSERAKVMFVLRDFNESLEERIWFGANLVTGVGSFRQPLKALKNAGNVAARLLLAMYAANDMETWGGVRPVGGGCGPWCQYGPVADDVELRGNARLIRAKNEGDVARIDPRISDGDKDAYWDALRALLAAGLIYEVVMVLNRNSEPSKLRNGNKYAAIPDGAEPLYELDCRSRHGYKPAGEEGLAGATANTAGAIGYPVATEGGCFDGTYAALVWQGFPAMVAGIYRLRFRVANTKNAGVKGAWARIQQGNRDALELIQQVRSAFGLPSLPAPS